MILVYTASRMSYLCSTNKKYCVSLWEFYVVGPQSGRDDVRPRGNEQPAYCVRRRPSMCFVGDTLFTAVLIPMLGGYLLVDDTLASWSDMLLLRRYWYISWANTDLSLGGHHAWTAIHSAERYTIPWLVGWCYFLPGRYTPWLALHLRVIHIFLRLPGRYTNWSALHFIHRSFSYLGDTYLVLVVYRPKSMFTNLRARFWKGLCYARAFVKLVDYHTYVHFNK